MARCNDEGTGKGPFTFIEEGLKRGNTALSDTAAKDADLVIDILMNLQKLLRIKNDQT